MSQLLACHTLEAIGDAVGMSPKGVDAICAKIQEFEFSHKPGHLADQFPDDEAARWEAVAAVVFAGGESEPRARARAAGGMLVSPGEGVGGGRPKKNLTSRLSGYQAAVEECGITTQAAQVWRKVAKPSAAEPRARARAATGTDCTGFVKLGRRASRACASGNTGNLSPWETSFQAEPRARARAATWQIVQRLDKLLFPPLTISASTARFVNKLKVFNLLTFPPLTISASTARARPQLDS